MQQESRTRWGLIVLGLLAAEVALVYVLIAVEGPWQAEVHRLLARPTGAFALLMGVTSAVMALMGGIVSIVRRTERQPAASTEPSTTPEPFPVPPPDFSLSNLTLGLALPAAVVALVVPRPFVSLWWLLLVVPVGLMTLVMMLVTVPTALSPAADMRRMVGNSRVPRLTALLIAGGALVNTGWLLGGAVARDLGSGEPALAGVGMLLLARLTYPLRR